jgi:phosphonate transport system substrate-binding protein
MRFPTSRRGFMAGALALPAVCAGAQPPPDKAWALSVVPQFPAAKLHRDWTPLIERVERDTGIQLVLKLAPTIPRFESEFSAGQPDFVYLNPYHQVMAHRLHGYLPLVRDTQPLSGILVVRRDAAIKSLLELHGKDVAFPAPNAFGASLWMRALLAEQEQITIRPQYVQTHSNVYRQVVAGRMTAGGGIGHTLAQESDAVRHELRVLFETPGAAPHPVSAHPRVPKPVRQAVTRALLQLAGQPTGQALLDSVQLAAPMAADQARDYQPLERYRLDRYVVAPGPEA